MALDIKKFIEEIKGASVLELNDLVKAIEEEFGVTAAAMVAGPAAGAGDAPAAEEKTEFNVILKNVGPNKINVIKVIREITGLGLIEAKTMVDGAPSTIKETVPKEAAEEILAKLKEAGAEGELK